MYRLCSNTTWLEFTMEYDLEFYSALGGPPTGYKKTVLNQYINLYVRRIKNTTTKQPLDASSQNQYLKQIFHRFCLKNIQYHKHDFWGCGGLLAVVKMTFEEKYIRFYKTFHKKFKNDENLILCSKSLSDGGVILNSDLSI